MSRIRYCTVTVLLSCLIILGISLHTGSASDHSPDDKIPHVAYHAFGAAQETSLNGVWSFRLLDPEEWPQKTQDILNFTDDALVWHDSIVPGAWELQGFAQPRYAEKLEKAEAVYKRNLNMESIDEDKTYVLQIEGVQYGFDLIINGQAAGNWSSSFNRSQFDITPYLKAGNNQIALRVRTHPKAWEFDTNDAWSLSGIYRDITLLALPKTYFEDLQVVTTDVSADSARLDVHYTLPDVPDSKIDIQGTLAFHDKTVTQFNATVTGKEGTASLTIPAPHLWTAETPNLYELRLAIMENDTPVQIIKETVGIRKISIKDGVLLLNGTPIKLRGINRHDITPKTGRTMSKAELRKDLLLIKKGNMNFIRTSHYPSDPHLYDLADELGLYIMNEIPFGKGEEYLKQEAYRPELQQRAATTVQRDKNHPSVIIWSLGNENRVTDITLDIGKYVKSLDKTRPICYPMRGSQFADQHDELPDFVDIYAPHYPGLKDVQDHAVNLNPDKPVIYTEYAHSMGLDFGLVEDIWHLIEQHPRLAGGAVWHFSDQGLLRKSDQPVSEYERTDLVWLNKNTSLDSFNDKGMDGIVYADRTPQVDFYQLRKVYAPIQVKESDIKLLPDTNSISLTIDNRFDFLSTEAIHLHWQLKHNASVLDEGPISTHIPARSTAQIMIPVSLPSFSSSLGYYTLEITATDSAGMQFYEKSIRLIPDGHENGILHALDTRFHMDDSTAISMDKNTGGLQVKHDQSILIENSQFHVGRIKTGTEMYREPGAVSRGKAPITSSLTMKEYDVNSVTRTKTNSGDTLVTVKGVYELEGAGLENQRMEGIIQYSISSSGIDVEYTFAPAEDTDLSGVFLEAGIAFHLPAKFTEFRWTGNGPYADYPNKSYLNDFGIHHLNRDDLYFQGNRSDVEVAILSSPTDGQAVVVIPRDNKHIAVKRIKDRLQISHNALVSGRGTKFKVPLTLKQAQHVNKISGSLRIVPIANNDWPEEFLSVFGTLEKSVPAFQPFYNSYEQNH